MAKPIMAYCLSLKETVEVEDPHLALAKNGRYMLKGFAKGTDKKISKFLSNEETEEHRKVLEVRS